MWATLVGAMVVLAGLAIAIRILTSDSDEPEDSDGFAELSIDFNGENGVLDEGRWTTTGGNWRQVAGAAKVQLGGPGPVFATVETGESDLIFRTRFRRAAPGAGVVFRFVDEENYWGVLAAPYYSTWTLIRWVDGEGQIVADSGDLTFSWADAVIEVRAVGRSIELWVDGVLRREVTDDTEALSVATRVGLLAVNAEAPEQWEPTTTGDGPEQGEDLGEPEDASWDKLEVLSPPD